MLIILQPGFCWLKMRLAVKESLAGTVVFCCTEFPFSNRKAIWYFFISIALSSGNHDAVGSIIPPARGPTYSWLVELDEIRDLVSDGQTAIIGALIVTTIPYYCDPQAKRVWLDRGRKIRQERKLKWLVLHHEPPVLRKSPGGEEREADALLRVYAPDYWLSGHIHDLPYELGGKWVHLIGETLVFMPGQVPKASWPNHVELDLGSGRISWRTTRYSGELLARAIEEQMVRATPRS